MNLISKVNDNDLAAKFLRKILAFYPYKLRKIDKTFKDFTKTLIVNEKKSYEEIKEYQFRKLLQIVSNAYQFSPFYKKLYDTHNFHPSELKDFSDYQKIPSITKDDIRKNPKSLVNTNYKGRIYTTKTSGSTGTPLTILRDKYTASKEFASICYQWNRIGFEVGDGRVEFRGMLEKNELFRDITYDRVLRINVLQINEKNIDKIVNKIIETGYQYFHGYNTALYLLFKTFFNKYGEFPSRIKLKGILSASEIPFDWQVDYILKMCPENVKYISHYGQAEKVCLAAWDNDRKYHFIPSYGITEFTADNQIVATGLILENVPLIRYQVNDIVEVCSEKSQGSKQLFPVANKILGRVVDFTYTNEHKIVPPPAVTFIFNDLKQIKNAKIVQHDLINFEVKFTTISNYNAVQLQSEQEYVKSKLFQVYGEKTKVKMTHISEFTGLKSGKFRWIENKMKK